MSVGIPASGWYVEIDDPNTGHTWTPSVIDDPQVVPGATDYPRITIPVKRNERWFDSRYEGAAMRVWKDGRRQPIEELENVTERQQAQQQVAVVELEGRGAVELDRRTKLEVDSKDAHEVVEDLITNNTSYQANVDTPTAAVRTNDEVLSADTTAEWQDILQPIPSTLPLTVQNGKLQSQQAAFHVEGEKYSLTSTNTDSAASEGEFEKINSKLEDSQTVSVPYTLPSDNVGIGLRLRNPTDPDSDGDNEGHGFDVRIDGESIITFGDNWSGSGSFGWTTRTGISSDLSGSTSITLDATNGDGNETDVDLVVLYDDRYNWTFDNSVDSDTHLSGPELKPDLVEIATVDALTAFQIIGGRVEITADDTSNDQRLGLSQDQGQTWQYGDNTEAFETDFNSGSAQLRAKFGVSRYGQRDTETPTTGFKSQKFDIGRLKADIDETPLLVNQDYDASLMEIIQDIADFGDFIGEFRLDGGSPSWEFTQAGQRTSGSTPTPKSYDYRKNAEQQRERVVILSGRQQVRKEEFTANHGTAVDLQNGRIDRGTESVYDPSTGTEYAEGADYTLSPGVESPPGSITTLAGGSITDGQTLAVDYNYHFEAESTIDNPPANPDTFVETFSDLTSQRAVDQASTLLLNQLDSPLDEVIVKLPTSEVGFNVVESQAFAALPTDATFDIQEIEVTPQQTVFRLGSRDSIGTAVSRIRRRLSTTTQRV
jgi:hypothetical protein